MILFLVSLPGVQTYIAGKTTNYLNEKYNVDININKIGLTYKGDVDLQQVFIRDHHQDTLLFAEKINTSILNLREIKNGQPQLGPVSIEDLIFNMKIYEEEKSDNLMTFIRKFNTKRKKETSKTFILTASQIDLERGKYRYINENLNTKKVLDLENILLNAEDFKVDGEDVSITTKELSFNDHRGLKISNLKTQFLYTKNEMWFKELEIITKDSNIGGEIQFSYKPEEFADFVNKVKINAVFDRASVSTNDLIPFYKEFGKGNILKLNNTNLKGTLNNFKLYGLNISGMDRSVINGDVVIRNAVENRDQFVLEGDFSNLTTNYYDLVNLLPNVLGESLPKQFYQFGSIRSQGNAIVTTKSVDIDMTLFSQLGKVAAFVILGELDDVKNATYNGNLIVNDFNVGALIGKPIFGKSTFNLDFDGRGFTLETLDTQIEGSVQSLQFNDYFYSNIKVVGNLKDPIFDGQLVSDDPNLKFKFNGVADLTKEINNYDFVANVDYLDLKKLNLFTRDSLSVFEGDVIMNMKGTGIDDAFGTISFAQTQYLNHNDSYYFDDFDIVSSFDDEGVRTIKVNSPDIIDGSVKGIFRFENVYDLFRNSIGSLYTNFEATEITDNEFMEFRFNVYNKIVEVFFPEIQFAPNTFINGKVESDESEFKLTFKSPEIKAFKTMMQKVDVQIDNKNPLFNTYIAVDSIASKYYDVSEFSLINVTLNDTLFMRSEFKGGENNRDNYNLSFYHTINENNKSVVGIRKSDLTFKDYKWFINENKTDVDSKIIFDNEFTNVDIKSIILSHKDEEVELSGVLEGADYKDIKASFKDVDLNKITPAIDSLRLSGSVEGDLSVLQKEGAYFPRSTIVIEDLAVNKNVLGELYLNASGNESLTEYKINTKMVNKGLKTLTALGTIDLTDDRSEIDLDVNLEDLNIEGFSALGGIVLEDLRGLVSGEAKVTGDYKNPSIDGLLTLNNTGLKIPYLNVNLDLDNNSKVRLSKQQFNFENVGMTDTKYKTRGTLGGFIAHQNFSRWRLGLEINTDRLLVLDTEAKEESLYYGTGFISGNATIKGPTKELVIDVNAATEEGTVFKIPLNDTESIGDNSYIHFLTLDEKKARLEGKDIIIKDIKGLELNFELNVKRNAEVEIVIDKNTGSSLKGRGAGGLLIEINTNGKFNMWGDFVAYEGTYNFRYGAFVEKVFNVRDGGAINWNGSPTRAVLDLSAVYKTTANPAVLLENPSINRKIPVEVVVDLKGELIQPEIGFNIEFPNLSSVVKSELQYQLDDRATRELQALSLVSVGQFYSPLTVNQSAVSGIVADRASSLVNGIFSNDDDKFQVGLDYRQGDRLREDAQNSDQFGVSLSTKINNRILINGRVGVPIGGVTESLFVGDVELEYLFNQEGSLRGKIFNRESSVQYVGENQIYAQGLGLSYSVDFDNFRELWAKIFKSKSIDGLPKKTMDSIKVDTPEFINFTNKKE